jgi:hypothetical protein
VISVTVRPLSSNEMKLINARRPSIYNIIEEYAKFFIGIYLVFLIPLLLIDNFFSISSTVQFAYCILSFFLTMYIVKKISKKYKGSNGKGGQSESNLAEVIYVKTNRAVERKDIEDLGSAFYLEVNDGVQNKTLFLWGQYLDELGERKFPNSEFELIRKADTKEFIGIELTGRYFKPEKTLPAFDKELWRNGRCHEDGQIINKLIDEIS